MVCSSKKTWNHHPHHHMNESYVSSRPLDITGFFGGGFSGCDKLHLKYLKSQDHRSAADTVPPLNSRTYFCFHSELTSITLWAANQTKDSSSPVMGINYWWRDSYRVFKYSDSDFKVTDFTQFLSVSSSLPGVHHPSGTIPVPIHKYMLPLYWTSTLH